MVMTHDEKTVDTTVLNADGTRTQTVTITSADGTLLESTVTTIFTNGLVKSVDTDLNGDGTVDTTFGMPRPQWRWFCDKDRLDVAGSAIATIITTVMRQWPDIPPFSPIPWQRDGRCNRHGDQSPECGRFDG